MSNHGVATGADPLLHVCMKKEAVEHFDRIDLVTYRLSRQQPLAQQDLEMLLLARNPSRCLGCLAGRTMHPGALRGGGGLWPEHTAMRAPHSRTPQSAREEDRECRGHNHEIESCAVQAEIHDRNKEQRKHENPFEVLCLWHVHLRRDSCCFVRTRRANPETNRIE